jgi:hypothetical protein
MGSAFSRAQAANALKNAKTATLRSALTNYINATKNMNANAIRKALANSKNGVPGTYRNRIANGVANAVVKSRFANNAVNAANAGVVSEAAAATQVNNAATAVNNAANKLKNLNALMTSLEAETPNRKIVLYKRYKRNFSANRALNAGRIGGPKYSNFFNSMVGKIIVAKANNQNNSPKNNRNSIIAIIKNNKMYPNNNKKINAIIAYNPGLNFSKLARNNNNAKIKNLLARSNQRKQLLGTKAAQHTGYNLGNNNQTGTMFKQANNYTPTSNNTVNTGKKIIGVKQKNGKYILVFKNSTGKWARANTVNYNTKNAALNAGKKN